jgi:O-antigen/teichoic acid export membrane protein
MLLLGGVGAVVMAALSPSLVHAVLRIPAAIQMEALGAFFLIAASLPVVITMTALRGFLEAHQRFGACTAVRIPLGIFTFAGPFLVLPFSANLLPIVGVLAVARLAACVALWFFCTKADPGLKHRIAIRWNLAPALFHFGGWMTVTNIVSPFMFTLDRFLIGAVVSISAVAYYATPSEVVIKLLIIPSAIAGVLFPAFSAGFAQDKTRTGVLFIRGVKYTFLAIFPLTLIVVLFAREGLTVWVGQEFARHSTAVLQLLAIGVFFNAISNTPFALVQGVGRPDITGKLHLIELPAYLVLLWFLVAKFGIVGAAVAWTTRLTLDSVALFLVVGRVLPQSMPGIRRALLSSLGALCMLILSALPAPLPIKLVFFFLAFGLLGLATWYVVLTPGEKAFKWNRGNASLPAS